MAREFAIGASSPRDGFDPLVEGKRHGLSRELALAIWARVRADATDARGQCDGERAARAFHAIAARLGARGGRPEVGRVTQVATEAGDAPPTGWDGDALSLRAPGRVTLVEAEARRAQMRRTFGGAAEDIAITTDSTRPLAAGAEGVAVGEQVYLAPGYYDLTTTDGRERLGHEVAHVLQQRRGRGLRGAVSGGERATLEAEADRAGHAFARGKPFAVQGRAPANIALFKGAAKPPAEAATRLDLKAGGRIERKSPTAAPSGKKPKEQLIITYGAVQASGTFTVERDANGDAKKLVGTGKLSLPTAMYVKQLDLELSLDASGYVIAKLRSSAHSTIQIGGLTIQSGTLTAGIARGTLSYALDGANLALPKHLGQGSLTMQGHGDQTPTFDASLAINVPKLAPSTMTFHADAAGYRAEGATGIDIKQASGTVKFGIEKVGDDKALWSAAGTVGYTSERLSGQIGVQYNADGQLSGEGALDFKIADFLTGKATVALDKEGHVTVNGEIRPPAEKQLFPEKKVENTFLHKSLEFPIWGISIPMVGSVGLIAFIEGSMGYRVGVGAGVMRDIVLSGSYSTDPSVQPAFQITGEIFIPAYAELLINIGGGIKLDAFVAEVGGGIKVDGRAGIYGGLSVRPTLAYENGQYRLLGQAIVAGDVGLSAQVDAFVRLHVGKWMFSWEKEWDWKLGEWHKWLGLNLGMEADLDYTLGQPLSPDIFKLKKPDSLDVQGIAQSAMPQGGMPAQGPTGAQNQKADFKQKGGGAAAPAATAQPKVAPAPAGAAGHKNQDPKGKKAKPAKPPRPGPAKQAKSKTASQTGPAPKSKSKPTEQKLDATPVIESFSMHGEPHQLIVQLGPSGHVDMASKRERLSAKIGHAVGKLVAQHAPPEQIAALKQLGAVAKQGDKMATTAKLPDKPGTASVAHQIAAYGNKWEVHDLDEVAVDVPRSLSIASAAKLAKLPDHLAEELARTASNAVLWQGPVTDAKQVTKSLLQAHRDAHFDPGTKNLQLPALHPAALSSATSPAQLGHLIGQQTGVSKVTLSIASAEIELLAHVNPVVKVALVEDELWLRALKLAVGPEPATTLCTRLTRATVKTLWTTFGEQPFKDLIAAFPGPEELKPLIGAFGITKLKALTDDIPAAQLSVLAHALSVKDLKTLITTLTVPTLVTLVAATDIATVATLAKDLKAKTLKELVAGFPLAELKLFVDRLTAAGVSAVVDKVGTPTLTRAKAHFGGTADLLDVLAAAAGSTAVLKDVLAACFQHGFHIVSEITSFFTHINGLGAVDVKAVLRAAEIFVSESVGNTTSHPGRSSPDPGAPVKKEFAVQGGQKVTLTFNQADVDHIASRHTWAGFAMVPSNAAVKDDQTMFPVGTSAGALWQRGRVIMDSAALASLMSTMSPGGKKTGAPITAGGAFKVNIDLAGAEGLVSFFPDGGAGVIEMSKAQMKAAIRLWKSK